MLTRLRLRLCFDFVLLMVFAAFAVAMSGLLARLWYELFCVGFGC